MKKRIIQFLSITLIILMVSACNSHHQFDSNLWKQRGLDWWMTDVREKMVRDLIESDTLIGLSKKHVTELLGQPKSEDTNELQYLIREKYGNDIDPEYISTLKIEFNDSGQARSCEIEK